MGVGGVSSEYYLPRPRIGLTIAGKSTPDKYNKKRKI